MYKMCIVTGPSCCGKTTFLKQRNHKAISEITRLPTGCPVIPANSFPSKQQQRNEKLKHLDIYVHMFLEHKPHKPRKPWHPKWHRIHAFPAKKRVIVLGVPLIVLQSRIRKRLMKDPRRRTMKGIWCNGFSKNAQDMIGSYKAWIDHLEEQNIPFLFVHCADEGYSVLCRTDFFSMLRQ